MQHTKNQNPPDPEIDHLFTGGGEMGERIRNFDWSQTSIGPVECWPQSLKTIVRIMLASRQPIWIGWGPELVKLYNDPYVNILGGKHPDALGKPAATVWAEIWPDIEPMLNQVMQKNEGTYVEAQLLIMERHGYSEETYYTFSYNPVPDENGHAGGMFCTNTDDTQRVLSKRAIKTLSDMSTYTTACETDEEVCQKAILAFSENQYDFPFSALYNINPDTGEATMVCASGNIFKNSQAFPHTIDLKSGNDIWNIAEALAIQKPVWLGDLTSRFGTLPQGKWKTAPNQAVVAPVALKGKDGASVVLITGINPYLKLDDRYRDLIRLLCEQLEQALLNVDIIYQERKRAEALEELNSAKTVFFSNISHEFRTPLTLMLGPLEELLNRPMNDQDKQEREILEITHRNAMRLLKLVNSLLDFSKIEAGRQNASFELEDIVAVTTDLASNFLSLIEKAGLKLEIEASSFIQPVYIDKEMWEKIVFNLLSNAFKYTLEGKITIKIYSEDSYAVLEVADTGIGIAKQEQSKIFERFHRSQNVMGRSFEGTGIGLSLVKELVTLHGGTISLKSVEGKGSTFTIKIPFGRNHLREESIRSHDSIDNDLVKQSFIEHGNSLLVHDTTEPTEKVEGLSTVMVVDDNADMRQYLVRLLKPTYNVVTAANGLDALHKVQKERPDILISDIMMPIMNGFEMMRQLRAQEATRSIPVIMLSARAGEEATIEGVDSGADDYLVKPFSAKELLARVAAHIQMADVRKKAADATTIERKRLYELFMQAPAAIAVLRGPDLIFEIANPLYLEIARKSSDILGKPIMEAIPELKGQPIEKILFDVYQSGKAYIGKEMPVKLVKDKTGIPENVYFNFVYQPFIAENGHVDGIMIHAVDVTEQVRVAQEK